MADDQRLDVSTASPEAKAEILKYAIEGRKSEIDRLWSRSLVFWGLVAAAFVSYAALFERPNSELPRSVMAMFGLLCSFAWTLQNRGSKYWQEAWESKVESVEVYVLEAPLFANREPTKTGGGFWGAQRFSVSRLMISVSDLAVVVWILLIIQMFATSRGLALCIGLITFCAAVAYAWGMWTKGRSRD